LYYRLNVIPIQLPPLRERPEDIPLLAEYFLRKHCEENQKSISRIAEDTLALLQKYQWRGNVRELENVIERSVLVCQDTQLEPKHLFLEEGHSPEGNLAGNGMGSFRGTIHEMERALIFQTLEEVAGNRTRAAEKLGISIRTLRNKLNEYKEQNPAQVS